MSRVRGSNQVESREREVQYGYMNIPLDTVLQTERCILRIPQGEDNECVWTASRVEGFTDGMLWDQPQAMQEIEAHRQGVIERWKKGEDFGFSICLKDTNECIGRIAMRVTDTEDVWNIGFWMHPDYQGKGLMKESVLKMIDWTFDELAATAIETAHAVWNKASKGLIMRCGFTHVRHNPKGFQKHGTWVEEEEYELTRADWQASALSS